MSTNITNETRKELYELCKTYLPHNWALISSNQLDIQTIADGHINQSYLCSLPSNIKADYNRVVIRIVDYERFKEYFTQTHVITIAVILSHLGLSPKLMAVFPNGTISQYIDCRYFDGRDDLNPTLVRLLAGKLAKFHSTQMPVRREPTNIYHLYKAVFNMETSDKVRESMDHPVIIEQIQRHKLQAFVDTDLIRENEWLQAAVDALQSPVVFSHNDFNRRNILVYRPHNSTQTNNEFDITLIDFDWTKYTYRGVDFGQYFCSWSHREVDFGAGEFPTDEQMWPFIDAYIDEMCKITNNSYRDLAVNSRHRIIMETKVFALIAFMKDILFAIWVAITDNKTDLMPKAEIRLKCYKVLKDRVQREYSSLRF